VNSRREKTHSAIISRANNAARETIRTRRCVRDRYAYRGSATAIVLVGKIFGGDILRGINRRVILFDSASRNTRIKRCICREPHRETERKSSIKETTAIIPAGRFSKLSQREDARPRGRDWKEGWSSGPSRSERTTGYGGSSITWTRVKRATFACPLPTQREGCTRPATERQFNIAI